MKNKKLTTGFTQVPNELLWNKELSLEQKAFLILLSSNAPSWVIVMKEIYSRSSNSELVQRKISRQLKQLELLYIDQSKNNASGRFESNIGWRLNKSDSWSSKRTISPITEKPTLEKPTVEIPVLVNQPCNNTTLNNTNSNNTQTSNTNSNNIKTPNANAKESINLLEVKEYYRPTLLEVLDFFKSIDKDESIAKTFHTEFSERNWVTLKNEPVRFWKSLAKAYKLKGDNRFKIPQIIRENLWEYSSRIFNHIERRERKNYISNEEYKCQFTVEELFNLYSNLCVKMEIDSIDKFNSIVSKSKFKSESFILLKDSIENVKTDIDDVLLF